MKVLLGMNIADYQGYSADVRDGGYVDNDIDDERAQQHRYLKTRNYSSPFGEPNRQRELEFLKAFSVWDTIPFVLPNSHLGFFEIRGEM